MRADDDGICAGIGAQDIERLSRGDPEPAALARRVAPETAVVAEASALLVDDLALCLVDAVAP